MMIADAQKLYTILFQCCNMQNTNIKTLTHGYQDRLFHDAFQNIMTKLVQEMEYVKTNILS
jgi:hypothetical protein